jgi:hypothetical protein
VKRRLGGAAPRGLFRRLVVEICQPAPPLTPFPRSPRSPLPPPRLRSINFAVMMRYISDKSTLKVIMQMLRHRQSNIQFEAFHVFKVFVANPEKPADIAEILAANKSKLIAFLQNFQNDKEDEQFAEEKAMLVDTLARLPDVTPASITAAAVAAASASAAAASDGGGYGGGAEDGAAAAAAVAAQARAGGGGSEG